MFSSRASMITRRVPYKLLASVLTAILCCPCAPQLRASDLTAFFGPLMT
jgi:hypothetical protein